MTTRTFTFPVAAQTAGFTPAGSYSVTPAGGSFVDGATITITGSGFTSKANAKPLLWIPMETNLQPHPTLSRTTTLTGLTTNATASIQSAIKPVNAAGAGRDLATTAYSPFFNGNPLWQFNNGETYVSVKRYYGHARAENLKMFRLWYSVGQYTSLLQSVSTNGRTMYAEPWNETSDTSGDGYYSTIPWDGFSWETHEYEFKVGTVNTYDGIAHYWMNGGLAKPYINRWKTRDDAINYVYRYGFLDQYTVNNPPAIPTNGTYYVYWNSLYADDSRHRVFVSDEPTFNTSVYGVNPAYNREVCIPTAWTDQSVTVVLRQGSHASLSGKYLYVVNGNGAAIKIGQFN